MTDRPTAITDLETAFAEAAAGKRVRFRRGRQTVAMISLADLRRLEELEEDAWLNAEADRALAEQEASGEEWIPYEEVRRRAGLT